MDIDNSLTNSFLFCPKYAFENYFRNGRGVEKIKSGEQYDPRDLGSRIHELLEEYYNGFRGQQFEAKPPRLPSQNEALEEEAQWIFDSYKRHYAGEVPVVIDTERIFRVPIPNSPHFLTGKIDLVQRRGSNRLGIDDHKSQKRGAKTNDPRKWAARRQASLYLWAASEIYGEEPENFEVNVLIRPSDAGLIGPTFWRDTLERADLQIERALNDVIYVADQIEKLLEKHPNGEWPMNTENCFTMYECDYYAPHTYGWSEALEHGKYQSRKAYLD